MLSISKLIRANWKTPIGTGRIKINQDVHIAIRACVTALRRAKHTGVLHIETAEFLSMRLKSR